ncbi:hypothetical protein JCM10449v2_000915 [Rhodotorula kratochvilovae]
MDPSWHELSGRSRAVSMDANTARAMALEWRRQQEEERRQTNRERGLPSDDGLDPKPRKWYKRVSDVFKPRPPPELEISAPLPPDVPFPPSSRARSSTLERSFAPTATAGHTRDGRLMYGDGPGTRPRPRRALDAARLARAPRSTARAARRDTLELPTSGDDSAREGHGRGEEEEAEEQPWVDDDASTLVAGRSGHSRREERREQTQGPTYRLPRLR